MSKIETGKKVKLHYTGKLNDEEVFDSSLEREPMEFTVGEGQLIPGFEKGVMGMSQGEKKTIEIEPADGYGELREDLIQEVELTQLPENVKVGDMLQATNGSEPPQPINVMVKEIKEDKALVDANHPLAGKKLIFDLEIVEVA
jgi:FKBP-type peptidyl-prolyl cis-trans isomerase SlpA|tara:strand:+ start:6365 stop:6793 length:429 start_codon:yes stop_codon:yes gene_type:complete